MTMYFLYLLANEVSNIINDKSITSNLLINLEGTLDDLLHRLGSTSSIILGHPVAWSGPLTQ